LIIKLRHEGAIVLEFVANSGLRETVALTVLGGQCNNLGPAESFSNRCGQAC
jgi:hypothetical protein